MEKKAEELTKNDDVKPDGRFYELLKICNNAEKPNPQAREELHNLVHSNQNCKKAMQAQLGMYGIALRSRIETKNSSDTFKEVLYIKCRQLKEELGFSTSNKLEQLAIEQIILCWVNLHLTEMQHANILAQSHSSDTGIYWEKRLTYSSRRYTRAMEMLSKMRKMNLIVQVNNANNQIINNRNK